MERLARKRSAKKKLPLGESAVNAELLLVVKDLLGKLKKKNEELTRTRHRLQRSKNNVQRLKAIIAYQRNRIIELHPETTEDSGRLQISDFSTRKEP